MDKDIASAGRQERYFIPVYSVIYRWNFCSISEALLEVDLAPCDVPTTSKAQARNVLVWLKTLAEPGKEEEMLLTENNMKSVYRLHPPAPGFAWCAYGWKMHCHLLGDVLVALGMTFPTSSICSPVLLVACWRQIAGAIEGVLAC
jgi:hypothetical protein